MTPPWAGGAWAELLHGLNLPVPSLQSLWIERTTLTLTHSLPGISRWFEVERRELVRNDSDGAGFTVLPQSSLGGPFSEEEEKKSASATCPPGGTTGSPVLEALLTFLLSFNLHSTPRQQAFVFPHPTPVLLPGESHGWRSLIGCSPWGC